MYTIGDFSKATGLPVKTLRFYHEKGLLIPAAVDRESGYRYYDSVCLERARVIMALREFEFSLDEISGILAISEDEGDILDHLERQKAAIAKKIEQQRNVTATIDRIIASEREVRLALEASEFQPEIRVIDAMLVAGIRVCGRYADCGPAFATLGKKLGRHIAGKPLCLYYDGEYRESDANFEPCMPVRNRANIERVDVRELPQAECLTLKHLGHYEDLKHSYAKILAFASKHEHAITLPTREIYIKGPGMIFKGNSRRYLTEIQLPIGG